MTSRALWLDASVSMWFYETRLPLLFCCTIAKSMWLEQHCVMPEIWASVLGVSALWLKQGWAWAWSRGSSVSLCHSFALSLFWDWHIYAYVSQIVLKIWGESTWNFAQRSVKYCSWRKGPPVRPYPHYMLLFQRA